MAHPPAPPARPALTVATTYDDSVPAKKSVMHSKKRVVRVLHQRPRKGEKMVDYEERAIVPSSSESDAPPFRPGTPTPYGVRAPAVHSHALPEPNPNSNRLVETAIYKAIDDFLTAYDSEGSSSAPTAPSPEPVPLMRTLASRGRKRETLRRPSPILEGATAGESSSRRKFKIKKSKSKTRRALPEGAAVASPATPLHRAVSTASLKSILKVKESPQAPTPMDVMFTQVNNGACERDNHPALNKTKTFVISYLGSSATSVEVTGTRAETDSEYSCAEDEAVDLEAMTDDEEPVMMDSPTPMSKTYVHTFHTNHTTTVEVDAGAETAVSEAESEDGDPFSLDYLTDNDSVLDSNYEEEQEMDLEYYLAHLTPVDVPTPEPVPDTPPMDASCPTSSSTASTTPPVTPQTTDTSFDDLSVPKPRKPNLISRELRALLTASQLAFLGRVHDLLAKTGLTQPEIVGILFDEYHRVFEAEREARLASENDDSDNAHAGPSSSGASESLHHYHSLGNDAFEAYIARILANAKSSRSRGFKLFRKSVPADEDFVKLLRALKAGLAVIVAEAEAAAEAQAAADADSDADANPYADTDANAAETSAAAINTETTHPDQPTSWPLRRMPSLRRLPSLRKLVNGTNSLKLRSKGKGKASRPAMPFPDDTTPSLTGTTFLPCPPTPTPVRYDESYTGYRDGEYDCDVESDAEETKWGSRRLRRLVKKRGSVRAAYDAPAATNVDAATEVDPANVAPEYEYYTPGVGTVAEAYARISGTGPQPKLAGSRRLHHLVNGDAKNGMGKGKRLERLTLDDDEGNGLGTRAIRRPSIPAASVRSTRSRTRSRTLSIRSFASARSREEPQERRPGTPIVSEWSDSTD